jgi:hypothetical protein
VKAGVKGNVPFVATDHHESISGIGIECAQTGKWGRSFVSEATLL